MSNEKISLIKWTSFPLRDYPTSSLFLVIFLIIFSFFFWKISFINWEAPLYFYIGMTALIISLLPYFIPTTYELYDEKIIIHYSFIKIEKEYKDFQSFYQDKKGIMLSTFRKPNRLDNFRGQSLRYSKNAEEKEKILSLLKVKIDIHHV